jgi:hypothetical protein
MLKLCASFAPTQNRVRHAAYTFKRRKDAIKCSVLLVSNCGLGKRAKSKSADTIRITWNGCVIGDLAPMEAAVVQWLAIHSTFSAGVKSIGE